MSTSKLRCQHQIVCTFCSHSVCIRTSIVIPFDFHPFVSINSCYCSCSTMVLVKIRPRGYKTWVHSKSKIKAQWLAACGHVSATSQSLRFILSLRVNSSFIASRQGKNGHKKMTHDWTETGDSQQCSMCDQQMLRSACACAVWSEPVLVAYILFNC